MSKNRSLTAAMIGVLRCALSGCLVVGAAGCTSPPSIPPPSGPSPESSLADPSGQATALDLQHLASAVASLGALATVCLPAPPAGFSPAGLELLASHSPAWFSALGTLSANAAAGEGGSTGAAATGGADGNAGTAGTGGDGGTGGTASSTGITTCETASLKRDLARTRTLAVRLAGALGEGVLIAVARAAAADEAILFDSLAGAGPPDISDLATIDPASATDLALAEDQAGFAGEYLAAQVTDAALQAVLASSAALHRDRAQRLVTMSGQPDPRQAAYQLGERPGDPDAARNRQAAVELALASHYATLPMGSGADLMVTWQLVEAASWGAGLPALPFWE